MKFEEILEKSGEIGYVSQIHQTVIKVEGLPGAKMGEIVWFEEDGLGQVFSLNSESVDILTFTNKNLTVGSRVARMDKTLEIPVGDYYLGSLVDAVGNLVESFDGVDDSPKNVKKVENEAFDIRGRKQITDFLETGVSVVDLTVPMGKGQRELVIGDRKTGKTSFLFQTITTQASLGTVCVYSIIGKRTYDVAKAIQYFKSKNVMKNIVIVSATASDPTGLIYQAPYTAMTIAEHFRDMGRDVLVVFDDLTAHARAYREISLLSGRFPGRNSYPGDLFYIHAKLLERAGSYEKGTISALPVVDSVSGDLSGFVQTNVMSITDGHLFFDTDLFNQGKRPAINPFLSVTRVGHQTQTPLEKEISRETTSFLSRLKRLRDLMHFGAELTEEVKQVLALGDRLELLFYQHAHKTVPYHLSLFLVGALWKGWGKGTDYKDLNISLQNVLEKYNKDENMRKKISEYLEKSVNFDAFQRSVDLSLLEIKTANEGKTN